MLKLISLLCCVAFLLSCGVQDSDPTDLVSTVFAGKGGKPGGGGGDDPACPEGQVKLKKNCVFSDASCANGVDDDNDGLTDCADSGCSFSSVCTEYDNCDDLTDNDLDGLTDCDDPDCSDSIDCTFGP